MIAEAKSDSPAKLDFVPDRYPVLVGVLAVQGDYEAHGEMLATAGAQVVFVRSVSDMKGIDALILPGGESSTQLQFLTEEGLDIAIKDFARHGGPILGTCEGAILLAREVLIRDERLRSTSRVFRHPAYESECLSDRS